MRNYGINKSIAFLLSLLQWKIVASLTFNPPKVFSSSYDVQRSCTSFNNGVRRWEHFEIRLWNYFYDRFTFIKPSNLQSEGSMNPSFQRSGYLMSSFILRLNRLGFFLLYSFVSTVQLCNEGWASRLPFVVTFSGCQLIFLVDDLVSILEDSLHYEASLFLA